MNQEDTRRYLHRKRIPQLFESMMTGLMYERPENHISFLQHCLAQVQEADQLRWDSFIPTTSSPFAPPRASTNCLAGNKNASISLHSNSKIPSKKQLPPIPQAKPGIQNKSGFFSSEIHSSQQPLPPIASTRPIIFILGGPGSGKGTQCERLVKDFGFTHLSTGDLLRAELNKSNERSHELKEIMREGKLVPPDVTIGLLKDAMLSNSNAAGFLIDGFPRQRDQGKIFEREVGECAMVLVFECSEEVMVQRLLQRGLTSGRADDNQDTIRKRLATFRESTLPVIEHYQSLGKVRKINSDRPVSEVHSDVHTLFHSFTSTPEKKPLPSLTITTPIVFVLGGPGSGKGTQCERLVKDFGFTHLSTGDLLREELNKSNERSHKLKEIMREGKLVPPDVTIGLLKDAMLSNGNAAGFLIDGFPRQRDQGKMFEREVGECVMVLVFECSEEVMVQRLLQRGLTSGRADDNQDTIRKRLATFRESTLPVIEHYQLLGKINSDRPVSEVHSDVHTLFHSFTSTPEKKLLPSLTVTTPIVFVLGGPGSGKGTQCERLVKDFGFTHLSTGDLLRAELNKSNERSHKLKEIMREGKLVPPDVTIGLLKDAMLSNSNAAGFLIDGFPRQLDQGKMFEREVGECAMVLVFECSEEVMVQRLLQRGLTSGRADDNQDTIRKRLATFRESTLPVIEHYQSLGKVRKINSDRPVSEVHSDVHTLFHSFTSTPEKMHK